MTNEQITKLLQEASKKEFLDAIQLIKLNEKAYKKSKFFKDTRIPLLPLYQQYYGWQKSKMNILEQLSKDVKDFDVNVVLDKIIEILNSIDNDPEVMEKINGFIEKFDPKSLNGLLENLQEEVAKIKL